MAHIQAQLDPAGPADQTEGDQQDKKVFTAAPAKQGLYDPQFERDACGMGFVVDVQGRPSHDIIRSEEHTSELQSP